MPIACAQTTDFWGVALPPTNCIRAAGVSIELGFAQLDMARRILILSRSGGGRDGEWEMGKVAYGVKNPWRRD